MTAFLGKAAAAMMSAAGSVPPPTAYGSYGLAMRFHVKVGDLTLGSWSGCQGLSVNFTPDVLREGGQYEHPWLLPGEVSYGSVTLERAMQKSSSATIRAWLGDVMKRWVNGNGAPYRGETVTITLCDGQGGEEVANWVLREAVPVAWLGPTMSGHSSEVAVERLQFAHTGFLPESGGHSGNVKATLKKSDADSVSFSYNPTSVSVLRGSTFRSVGAVANDKAEQVIDVEPLRITVTNLRLEGVREVAQTTRLSSWLEPEQKPDRSKGNGDRAQAQRLEFQMGGGIHYDVTLTKLDVRYTRFTGDGAPVRAEVSVTLADAKQRPPKQNPTSGGPPGRRAHTVVEGDNLQRIAQATYANPNAWRDIATANGIDDPLRMRNGRVLLLPGES